MQITPSSDDLIIEHLDDTALGMDDPTGWCFILTPGATLNLTDGAALRAA